MSSWILAESVFFSVSSQRLSRLDGLNEVSLSIREVLLLEALLKGNTDKRTLIEIVWPNLIVSDGSYHKVLFELRAHLQSIGLPPSAIKTIPRRGCTINFTAVMVAQQELAAWQVMNGIDNGLDNPQYNVGSSDPIIPIIDESPVPSIDVEPSDVNSCEVNNEEAVCVGRNSICEDRPTEHKSETASGRFIISLCVVVSVLFSCLVLYVMSSSSDRLTVYEDKKGDKVHYVFSKTKTEWPEKISIKSYSSAFNYNDVGTSTYFLCDKMENKCVNYIYISH